MATRLLLMVCRKPSVRTQVRHFHGTASLTTFYESPRSNYPVKHDRPPAMKQTIVESVKKGFQYMNEETKMWIQEKKDWYNFDITADFRMQRKLFEFTKDPAVLDKWVVTCDSDYDQGYSSCSLELSADGTGVFTGRLDTKLPKDGRIKFAGYCNMKSVEMRKSFYRKVKYDFDIYSHLILRIRGDGRPYLMNLYCKGYHDLVWHDVYHYPIFTTGGPFWQVVKIPFSKFVFSSKGVIQDDQMCMQPEKVTSLGITIADKATGPFKLEIDYIGLELDRQHFEKFAYETYRSDGIIM